ncbi:hypothetical protein, partial [Leptospira kemamanensis]|uniref:hypothetical protein n=1 Tax=Leptospira kemamanensis TaxID=2484942 RepID=UPI0010824CAF
MNKEKPIYITKPFSNTEEELIYTTARISQPKFDSLIENLTSGNLTGDLFYNSSFHIFDKRRFYQIPKDSLILNFKYPSPNPESINGKTCKVDVFYSKSQTELIEHLESLKYS